MLPLYGTLCTQNTVYVTWDSGRGDNQLIQIPILPLQDEMSCPGHTTALLSHRFKSSPLLIGKYQNPGLCAPLRSLFSQEGGAASQRVCFGTDPPFHAKPRMQSQVPCMGYKPLKKNPQDILQKRLCNAI